MLGLVLVIMVFVLLFFVFMFSMLLFGFFLLVLVVLVLVFVVMMMMVGVFAIWIAAFVIRTVVMVMVAVVFEEMRVICKNTIQRECADAEDLVELDGRSFGHEHCAKLVDTADVFFDLFDVFGRDEILLVENDPISESHLFDGLIGDALCFFLLEMEQDMLEIDDSDDRIQSKHVGDFFVHVESLDDGTRVGESSGFDEHQIEFGTPLSEVGQNANQVTTHRAAHASIVHFKDLFIGVHCDKGIVDSDFAIFVLDDCNTTTVIGSENVIQQSGLARTKKSGHDAHESAVLLVFDEIIGQRAGHCD